ncbi:MAG: hypothetical protein M3Y50_08540 [Acidobacteriota bacterium]|nr:hypothetical protein [Acidobacteriota bacterium]
MAISARSRRGTSASFWRNHNAMQMMMAQACMPSVRPLPTVKADRTQPVAPVWFPTPMQRERYQARSNGAVSLSPVR